jgi:uncharacterized membrane protein YdjX (TVP38/TMEM64 family)
MNKVLPFRQSKRKFFVFGIVILFLAVLAWYVNVYVSLEELVRREDRLRTIISLQPWRSLLIGFGIYTVLSFIPGTGGKAIICGWLFGLWQAVAIVTVGLTIAAMAIFSLSRYLFQERIEQRYTKVLSGLNKHLEKEGAFYLVTLRLLHFPYSILNPVSGASRVSAWTFFWTTLVGLFPSNAIWTYVGARLPSLRELIDTGAGSLIDPPLIGALMATATLPLIFRWMAGRLGVSTAEIPDSDGIRYETERPNL